MITLSDVHKTFGTNAVLRGVDLTIDSGTSMVIIGGSGTGKSVLLKCILGLVTPDSGTITLDEIAEKLGGFSSAADGTGEDEGPKRQRRGRRRFARRWTSY